MDADATTPFAGTKANFQIRAWMGALVKYRRSRLRERRYSIGRTKPLEQELLLPLLPFATLPACPSHPFPSFLPPHLLNTSRPSIGRLAPKRELLEPRGSLRICTWAKSQPAKFLRKQIQSKSTA